MFVGPGKSSLNLRRVQASAQLSNFLRFLLDIVCEPRASFVLRGWQSPEKTFQLRLLLAHNRTEFSDNHDEVAFRLGQPNRGLDELASGQIGGVTEAAECRTVSVHPVFLELIAGNKLSQFCDDHVAFALCLT